ncbi:cell wall-binding repeat-containing protein [Herbiconiux solani]|uniref:cell wall-binding repeat-containing protein n=1 Tax=Herbiconiux solani TaxID=661329 RepID=UPI000826D272|nr:cell wall-binding repeat-containing protein [Herbiconiux solani]
MPVAPETYVSNMGGKYIGTPTALAFYGFTMPLTETIGGRGIEGLYRRKVVSTTSVTERIGGADRYETSVLTAKRVQPGTATIVYIASGENFADALSASAIAAQRGAPLMLAMSTSVPKVVADAVSDLRATAGTATRVEGVNRYVGSAKVAGAFFPATPPSDTVYFATGATYPDALAGGVLAGQKKAPILLVSKSCMMAEVAAEVRRLNPAKIVLLGGPSSLDATLGDLPVCP